MSSNLDTKMENVMDLHMTHFSLTLVGIFIVAALFGTLTRARKIRGRRRRFLLPTSSAFQVSSEPARNYSMWQMVRYVPDAFYDDVIDLTNSRTDGIVQRQVFMLQPGETFSDFQRLHEEWRKAFFGEDMSDDGASPSDIEDPAPAEYTQYQPRDLDEEELMSYYEVGDSFEDYPEYDS